MPELERRTPAENVVGMPFALSITDRGLTLGYGTRLARLPGAGSGVGAWAAVERALCLIACVQPLRQPARTADALRKALAAWADGDGCLAHIRIAQLGLARIGSEEQARRLSLVENLLDSGLPPRELATLIGIELPSSNLSPDLNTFDLDKYDPDQPRNPAGSGVESGRWTESPTGGTTVARALVPAAPSLAEGLGAEAVTWLARLAGRLALPAALFGAAFVPSPNPGVAEEGSIPDRPGLRYRLDRDTGTLRLSDANDSDPTHALVAQLGADGVYRDVATRLAVARAIGDSVVLIDLDRAPAGSHEAAEGDDRPKLCPAPQEDRPGGRKLFDQMYEQYVRDTVNPQRRPQLPPGLTFALPGDTPSGWVHYDDCREADGAMIEAKGNYAEMLATQWGRKILADEWVGQARKQGQAAGNRPVEWYFHDPDAAAFAHKWFEANKLGSIRIHVLPYPGGVPKPNPRIR